MSRIARWCTGSPFYGQKTGTKPHRISGTLYRNKLSPSLTTLCFRGQVFSDSIDERNVSFVFLKSKIRVSTTVLCGCLSAKGPAGRGRLQIHKSNFAIYSLWYQRLALGTSTSRPKRFVVERPSDEHFPLYRAKHYGGTTQNDGGQFRLRRNGIQRLRSVMAYQGVIAYLYSYDQIYFGHTLSHWLWESDCHRRASSRSICPRNGGTMPTMCSGWIRCRQHSRNGKCEKCRVLPIDQTITAHLTACVKPRAVINKASYQTRRRVR